MDNNVHVYVFWVSYLYAFINIVYFRNIFVKLLIKIIVQFNVCVVKVCKVFKLFLLLLCINKMDVVTRAKMFIIGTLFTITIAITL